MSGEDDIYEDENAPMTGLKTRFWLTGVAVMTLALLAWLLKFG